VSESLLNVVDDESGEEGGLIKKLMAVAPLKHNMVPRTLALLYLQCTENLSNLCMVTKKYEMFQHIH